MARAAAFELSLKLLLATIFAQQDLIRYIYNTMSSPFFENNPWCESIYVVLVEPGNSLNIGAVARALSNLGFKHLRLVAPPRYERQIADTTACWGTHILDSATVYANLPDALQDMQDVVGFSARGGKNRAKPQSLTEFTGGLSLKSKRKIALLFGPEDTGLTHKHTCHCRHLIYLPASQKNSSYNLAQAVLIALYEISRNDCATSDSIAPPTPDWGKFSRLDSLVNQVLELSSFYNKGTPEQIPELVQNLWRRMQPDDRELSVLLGMFSRIKKSLRGEIPVQSNRQEDRAIECKPDQRSGS